LLEQHELLGPLDPCTGQYAADIAQPRCAAIAAYCRTWNRRFHPLYRALRNVARSDLGAGYFTASVQQYRLLQVKLLGTLLDDGAETGADQCIELSPWYAHGVALAEDVSRQLQRRSAMTPAERILMAAAHACLERAEVADAVM
jgi:hypothetical protein